MHVLVSKKSNTKNKEENEIKKIDSEIGRQTDRYKDGLHRTPRYLALEKKKERKS